MSSDYDATEFIDGDFEGGKPAAPSSYGPLSAAAATPVGRAPTPQEVDSQVTETHQRLVELKRAQENLERERAALEETRRRQLEFQTGRQEMLQNLTRGIGLLQEAEFSARRDTEQMAKAIADLKQALANVEGIQEETWTAETFKIELTKALTAIENARMEWHGANLKFAVLGEGSAAARPAPGQASEASPAAFGARGFPELCRLGLALTWPIAVSLLLITLLLLLLYLR